jgi:C1A family cysteine protease
MERYKIELNKTERYKMGWKFDNIENIEDNDNLGSSNNEEKIDELKYDIYNKYKDYFPEIADQGNIESCVPTCISTVYYYLTMKQSNYLNFRISRLYLYYQFRRLYDNVKVDEGSTIRDCINILHKDGIVPEFLYPYIESRVFNNPSEFLEKYSKFCKCLGFENISRKVIKQNLLLDNPVLCGIKLFESIYKDEVKNTGIINYSEEYDKILGGHCIILVGFDDDKKYFKFINSWGSTWGDKGFGYLPYEYIKNIRLSNEFYIIKNISNPSILLEESDSILDKFKNKFKNIFN